MKTQEDNMHTERGSSHTNDGGTDPLDQEAIARLAYFYWEARGCYNDSPDEDWFRAEAEFRNRLAAAAMAERASRRTELR
jgi:hypothetical protein